MTTILSPPLIPLARLQPQLPPHLDHLLVLEFAETTIPVTTLSPLRLRQLELLQARLFIH